MIIEIITQENIGHVLHTVLKDDDIKKFLSYTINNTLIEKQQKKDIYAAKKRFALNKALIKYNRIFKSIIK